MKTIPRETSHEQKHHSYPPTCFTCHVSPDTHLPYTCHPVPCNIYLPSVKCVAQSGTFATTFRPELGTMANVRRSGNAATITVAYIKTCSKLH